MVDGARRRGRGEVVGWIHCDVCKFVCLAWKADGVRGEWVWGELSAKLMLELRRQARCLNLGISKDLGVFMSGQA